MPAAAAEVAIDQLLGVAAGERILITLNADGASAFSEAIRAAIAARGASFTEVRFRPRHADAVTLTEAALASSLPDAIIELASITLYDSAPMRRFIGGGGRILSLPEVDDATAARLIAPLDIAAMRVRQSAIVARLKRARVMTVETDHALLRIGLRGAGLLRALVNARRRSRSVVFGQTPMPLVRGQFAFLPGQASVRGRKGATRGGFVADALVYADGTRADVDLPIHFRFANDRLLAVDGQLTDAIAWAHDKGSRIKHVSFGFLAPATFDHGLLEAERVLGSVTVGFGDHPRHIDAINGNATVRVDGEVIIERGRFVMPIESLARGQRRAASSGLMRRVSASGMDLARPLSVRRFAGANGRIAFVGACPQEGAWLHRWSGRSLGAIDALRVRPLMLSAALEQCDLALIRVSAQRCALERIDGASLVVPTLIRQVLDLDGVKDGGLKSIVTNSAASNDLRVMRKEKLERRATPLTEALLLNFHERFYVPTLRTRYGALAGYAAIEELAALIDSADLVEVMRDGVAIAATIVTRDGDEATLVQGGLLNGDNELLKARALVATYLFGAEHAAHIGAARVNFGGSLPFLRDGVLQFKSKWGGRLAAPALEQRYALTINWSSPAALSFIEATPIIALDRDDAPFGLARVTASTDLARLFELFVSGLSRLMMVLDGVEESAVRAALAEREITNVRCVQQSDVRATRDVTE